MDDDIQVSDVDGDNQTVTFTITGGVLRTGTSGITFDPIDANGTYSFAASGTLTDINTALDAATFTPTANLNGTDVATIAFTSNDGTEDSNEALVTFSITAVNDAPVNSGAPIINSGVIRIGGTVSGTKGTWVDLLDNPGSNKK